MGTTPILGTDILEGHGDFAIDADPYFAISAGMTIVGGKGVFDSVSFGSIQKNGVVSSGQVYECAFTLDAVTGGGIRVSIGGVFGTTRNTPGTFVENVKSAGENAAITGIGGSTGTFDNFIIRKLTYKKTSRSNLAPSNKLSL